MSRREARRAIDGAWVVVNGNPVGAASREIRAGDRIAVLTDAPAIPMLERTAERIVIDKPPGLASQMPRRNGPPSVLEVLAAELKREGAAPDLWVVHRLDTGTSGVLVLARAQKEAARLSRLFAERAIEKTYLALLRGSLQGELVLDDPIARAGSASFAIAPGGRESRTLVRPLRTTASLTLAEITIATGRSHQIRVHLSGSGFPIIGDAKYGGPPAERLMLHAWKLAHPDLGAYEAPPPDAFGLTGGGISRD